MRASVLSERENAAPPGRKSARRSKEFRKMKSSQLSAISQFKPGVV
jgi:hypothetical protein